MERSEHPSYPTNRKYTWNISAETDNIYVLPDDIIYTIVSASCSLLLEKRIANFKKLNPNWSYLGGITISSTKEKISYNTTKDGGSYDASIIDSVVTGPYYQTFIRDSSSVKGGSIRQKSRKNRLYSKKRD